MVIQNRAKKAKAVEDEEKARILGVYAEKPKMEATAARTHRPRPLADGFQLLQSPVTPNSNAMSPALFSPIVSPPPIYSPITPTSLPCLAPGTPTPRDPSSSRRDYSPDKIGQENAGGRARRSSRQALPAIDRKALAKYATPPRRPRIVDSAPRPRPVLVLRSVSV
ncbi:hypothetical protein EMMF5_004816 [Cystobasidiomycetes sp. EMM_F5]